jgi:CubicO group peptidase (beta-lactamase class C family)
MRPRRSVVRIVVATLLATPGLRAQAPVSTNVIRRLDGTTISVAEADAFARKTLEAAHVTGAQLAILDRGRLVWSAAYGLRRRDPQLPMESATTTWAASITKGVFATCVMQLIERGELNLDTPIAAQLSQPLNAYEPYKETGTEIVNDPRWATVTPRMLLAHTSGLRNFASLESDKKMRLHFTPGTQYWYSGEGINLLQFVIEQKKHKPLDSLMWEAIFAPLGMTRTNLIYRAEFAPNVADRYNADEGFIAQTRRFPARGAGSMTTSVQDLALFFSALFADRIIKATVLRITSSASSEVSRA